MTRTPTAIDRELALLAVVRTAVRALGGRPTTTLADHLLDERIDLMTGRDADSESP